MSDELGAVYLDSVLHRFRVHKKLAEAALKQLTDEQLVFSPGESSNSIAVILQHLHGNMISRWTDFLTTDGDKPTRDRDGEFVLDPSLGREERMRRWEEGWSALFAAIESLQPGDLNRSVTIRGQSLGVLDAIERQVFHIAYHLGQILYAAKILSGDQWRYLSIPPGKSGQYRPGARD
jgi:hypothetical protein